MFSFNFTVKNLMFFLVKNKNFIFHPCFLIFIYFMWTLLYELLDGIFFDIVLCYPFVQAGIFLLDFLKLNLEWDKIPISSDRFYKKRLVIKRLLKKQFNIFFK
jgi:hypothetical protein